MSITNTTTMNLNPVAALAAIASLSAPGVPEPGATQKRSTSPSAKRRWAKWPSWSRVPEGAQASQERRDVDTVVKYREGVNKTLPSYRRRTVNKAKIRKALRRLRQSGQFETLQAAA